MRKEEFEKKDGTKGVKYKFDAGDKVVSRFPTPNVNQSGKYPNYSIGVTDETGNEIYIQLTKGQYDKILAAGDVTGKTIEAYSYKNSHGEFVGVKVV